jgi:hypothetical protein
MKFIPVDGPPVGRDHYVEALSNALALAKHQGTRVVLDVWDAEQLLVLLDKKAEQ